MNHDTTHESPERFAERVASAYMNEGLSLLGEGVPAEAIEAAALEAGMPAGPLAMLDDYSIERVDHALHQELHDLGAAAHCDHCGHDHGHDHGHSHAHAHAPGTGHDHAVKSRRMTEQAVYVMEKMAHGFRRMGRAAGAGFYDYPADGPRELWSGLSAFVRRSKKIAPEDVRDRLRFVQIIETLRDAAPSAPWRPAGRNASTSLPGFPAGVGGFVAELGETRLRARASELAERYGSRFVVAGHDHHAHAHAHEHSHDHDHAHCGTHGHAHDHAHDHGHGHPGDHSHRHGGGGHGGHSH